jgi:FkbM family methyltransferase
MALPELLDDSLDGVLAGLDSLEGISRRESGTLEARLQGLRKAVIFGADYLGRLALSGARRAGLEVVAFADNNSSFWGQFLQGIPIVAPADAVARHNRDAFFVVAIYNSSSPRKQLQDLGCERIVPYPAFFRCFWQYMPEESRLELPHRILASVNDIRTGYKCLSDNKSRQEFIAQIAWRSSLEYERLPSPDSAAEMYFSQDIMTLSDSEVLVDCGAFDGDTIRTFLDRTSGSFRHIYAFEPDPSNRDSLQVYLSSLPNASAGRISVLPFGISNRSGTGRFNASGTVGSRFTTDESANSIECRCLDDVLDGIAPTVIKMDIEGSEPDAIIGATATIRARRPILAVCAYHKCEHLWTLPRLMKAALPEYQISLRRYAEECWETVYYAVPPERVIQGR